jgi:hypothetical protein
VKNIKIELNKNTYDNFYKYPNPSYVLKNEIYDEEDPVIVKKTDNNQKTMNTDASSNT